MKSFKLLFAIAAAFLLIFIGDALASWRDMSNNIVIARYPSFTISVIVVWLGAISAAMAVYFVGHGGIQASNPSVHRYYILFAICLSAILTSLPGSPAPGVWAIIILGLIVARLFVAIGWLFIEFIPTLSPTRKKEVIQKVILALLLLALFATCSYPWGPKKLQKDILQALGWGFFIAMNYAVVCAALALNKLHEKTAAREARYGAVIIAILAVMIDFLALSLDGYALGRGITVAVFYFVLPYAVYSVVMGLSDPWRFRISTAILILVTTAFIGIAYTTSYVPKMLKHAEEMTALHQKVIAIESVSNCIT